MVVSVIIIGSQYQKLAEEPVFVVTVSVSALLIALCLVDVVLVAMKRGRGVMVGISAVELIPGLLWLGLFFPVGLVIMVPNVLALVSLREKKTPEELALHPPVPRTRNYRLVLGAGVVVMLGSLFLPWVSTADTTLSLFGLYSGIATHSDLPSISISPTSVVFALVAIAGSPLAIVFGALGIRFRKLSLVAGVLGVAAGAGLLVATGGSTGVGEYAMCVGGVLALAAFVGFRRA